MKMKNKSSLSPWFLKKVLSSLAGLLLLASCDGTNKSYEVRVYITNETAENLAVVYKNFYQTYEPARFEIGPQSDKLILKDEVFFDEGFGSASTGDDVFLIFNSQDSLLLRSDSCGIQNFELVKLNVICGVNWERGGNRPNETYRFYITDTLLNISRLRDTL